MARHVFIPHPLRQEQSTAEDTSGQERHNVKALRDVLRSGDSLGFTDFNVALNSSRWKVSDIVMLDDTYEEQYAFLLRDTTNGIEYMFVFAGRDTTTSVAEVGDYILWDGTYLQPVDGTAYASGDGWTHGVFINPDYATSSFGRNWGFDNATEMTFTGGDFKDVALTSDPGTGTTWADDWWPSGVDVPRGVYFVTAAGAEDMLTCYIIDDVEDALCCMRTTQTNRRISQIAILSDNLFVANTAGDTRLQGVAWFYMTEDATNFGTHNAFGADGFTNTGTAISNFALFTDDNLTDANHKVSGNYKWRSIVATAATFDKGWINDKLAVEIGAFNSWGSFGGRFAHPDANNPCLKLSNGVAFMWGPNLPAFPFWYDGIGDVGGQA